MLQLHHLLLTSSTAIKFFSSSTLPSVTPHLLKQCKSSTQISLIHQQILVQTRTHQFPISLLISAYISHNSPSHALSFLKHLPPSSSSVSCWNALIRRDVALGLFHNALLLFLRMMSLGWQPNHYTFSSVLKACGGLSCFRCGSSVHALVCASGFASSVFVCNALVAVYSRCRRLDYARQMFDEMLQRAICDTVSWNTIVAGYIQSGDAETGLTMFNRMTGDVRIRADVISLVHVLPACASRGMLLRGKQVHGHAVRRGFFENIFVGTALVDMYAKCGMMEEAKKVFGRMEVKNVVSWNTMVTGYSQIGSFEDAIGLFEEMRKEKMELDVVTWSAVIAGYAQRGHGHEALDAFRQMQSCGSEPNVVTLMSLLSACASIGALLHGKEIHCYAIKSVLSVEMSDSRNNLAIINALIDMYAKCKEVNVARAMFDAIEPNDRDVVAWTVMIGGYAQHGEANDALQLFAQMFQQDKPIKPNAFTISCVLMASARLAAMRFGRQIHAYVLRNLYESKTPFLANCLIDMYSKSGDIDAARVVFDNLQQRNVVSWNAMVTGYSQMGGFEDAVGLFEEMRKDKMELDVVTWSAAIAGYAQRGHGHEALDLFRQMQSCGSEPNVVTLMSLLSACASIGALIHGKEIHCYAIKSVLSVEMTDSRNDLAMINALIDMYAKCKEFNVARAMFDAIEPKDRDVVAWTVMIGGYAQHGEANDALKLFAQMFQQDKPIKPNAFTISCALMASARLAAMRFGRQIHAYVLRNLYESKNPFVANCLIDMYSKSGYIDAARVVFDNLQQRNVVSWTSLMTGYGMHGHGDEALRLVDEMRKEGLVPDDVASLVVLYACSHSGMVDQGLKYFDRMSKEFGITPGPDHYACIVDLLGRAGRLNEAMKLIDDMPMKSSPVIWTALLSGCRIHANVKLGEYAANQLLELESVSDGSYTLLSNIYANAGRWKDVARIRSFMRHTGIKKRPGCSWIQGREGTTTFLASDWTHPQSKQIYEILADLIQRIKAMGYAPETSFALHDVDDEEKGDLLFEHSEKLALAYGILTTASGVPIHITKNLRICGDCHTVFTYVTKIIKHEIILRDSSRFHHFKEGSCSCRGYW